MFSKLAKFKAIRFRHDAWLRHGTWPDGRLHAGGNRAGCHLAPASPSTVRPVLVCHWQPASGRGRGGGLECRWTIETVGETADGEPEGSWAVRQVCRLTGIALPAIALPPSPCPAHWRGGRRPDNNACPREGDAKAGVADFSDKIMRKEWTFEHGRRT